MNEQTNQENARMREAIEEMIDFLTIDYQLGSPSGLRVYDEKLCNNMLEMLRETIKDKEVENIAV